MILVCVSEVQVLWHGAFPKVVSSVWLAHRCDTTQCHFVLSTTSCSDNELCYRACACFNGFVDSTPRWPVRQLVWCRLSGPSSACSQSTWRCGACCRCSGQVSETPRCRYLDCVACAHPPGTVLQHCLVQKRFVFGSVLAFLWLFVSRWVYGCVPSVFCRSLPVSGSCVCGFVSLQSLCFCGGGSVARVRLVFLAVASRPHKSVGRAAPNGCRLFSSSHGDLGNHKGPFLHCLFAPNTLLGAAAFRFSRRRDWSTCDAS